VLEAVLRGMPKAEVARSFGIGISTVKGYVDIAHKGEDLAPRRPPLRRRTLDEVAMRLLESDLKKRPALTLARGAAFWSESSGRRKRVDDLPSDQGAWMASKKSSVGAPEEVRQWWRCARVRQRKTTLVTIPSNQPRMAEKMTIQTSDTVDEPTTQLNST
jgi:transposase